MLGGPEDHRLTEADIDYQSPAPANPENLELSKKSEETLKELEVVLHEDKPKTLGEVSEPLIDMTTVQGDASEQLKQVAEELRASGIDTPDQITITTEDAEDEEFTDTFVNEAKAELERILTPTKERGDTK